MTNRTAKQHLDWSVERAMEYANQGDMSGAWASFVSDVNEHPGTEHIANSPITGGEMVIQTRDGDSVETFHKFITGWNVGP